MESNDVQRIILAWAGSCTVAWNWSCPWTLCPFFGSHPTVRVTWLTLCNTSPSQQHTYPATPTQTPVPIPTNPATHVPNFHIPSTPPPPPTINRATKFHLIIGHPSNKIILIAKNK